MPAPEQDPLAAIDGIFEVPGRAAAAPLAPSDVAVPCAECGAAGRAELRFCEACGAALRDADPLLTMEILPALRRGRRWILALALLQAVVGGLLLLLGDRLPVEALDPALAACVAFALAVTNLGLWLWARRAPLAAAVTALLVFVAPILVDAIARPGSLLEPVPLALRVLFILGLLDAVRAGIEVRRLRRRP